MRFSQLLHTFPYAVFHRNALFHVFAAQTHHVLAGIVNRTIFIHRRGGLHIPERFAQARGKGFAVGHMLYVDRNENLAQFRELAPEKLFEAWQQAQKQGKGGFQATAPCLDGRLVVDTGVNVLAAGKQHNIPYMAGATSEDIMPPIIFSMSRSWCAAQEKPSYTWMFDRQLPGDDCGAWHSSDLWYWFGTLDNCWRPMEQKDRELSDLMTDYLCNFAKNGDPNRAAQVPTWIASDKTQKRVMVLGEKPAAMKKPSVLKMVGTMLTNKAVGE